MGSVTGRETIFVPFLSLCLNLCIIQAFDCLIFSLHLFGAIVFIHLLLFLPLCFIFSVLCLFFLSFPSVLFLPLLFPGDGVNWRIRVVMVWMSKVVSERTLCLSKKTTAQVESILVLRNELKMTEGMSRDEPGVISPVGQSLQVIFWDS